MQVQLKKPISDRLRAGHPWVYRDALEMYDAAPGEVLTVVDRRGQFVGRGLAEDGVIGLRLWTTRDEPLDGTFIRRRILRALALRDVMVPPNTTAYRLVHGEGDRLGGFALDRYGDFAVARLDGEAVATMRDTFADVLKPILEERGVRGAIIRGSKRSKTTPELWWGDKPTDSITVLEHGMKLRANLWRGQKTGLFLDHRESRRRSIELAKEGRALNLYGYTGGFSAAAGIGGAAHVTTVDVATDALEYAKLTWDDNGLDPNKHVAVNANVPEYLDQLRREQLFDFIVCDPPSFAPNEKAVPSALRAYETLHKSCLSHLAPGGYCLAASCSSHIGRQEFEACLRAGAKKAGRVLQVVERWAAPPDHPTLVAFDEGNYLKVTLVRALG